MRRNGNKLSPLIDEITSDGGAARNASAVASGLAAGGAWLSPKLVISCAHTRGVVVRDGEVLEPGEAAARVPAGQPHPLATSWAHERLSTR